MRETYTTKIMKEHLGKYTICDTENLSSKMQLLYGVDTVMQMSEIGIFKKDVILSNLNKEDIGMFNKICAMYGIVAVVLSTTPYGETTLINVECTEKYTTLVLRLVEQYEGRELTELEKTMITGLLERPIYDYDKRKKYLDTNTLKILLKVMKNELNGAGSYEKLKTIYERINNIIMNIGE